MPSDRKSSDASEGSPLQPIPDAELHRLVGEFTAVHGTLPFCRGNVSIANEKADLKRIINDNQSFDSAGWDILGYSLMIIPFYAISVSTLVDEGQYLITMNNGKPKFYTAGRYFLHSPVEKIICRTSAGNDLIQAGPISIIRVSQGQLGLAIHNGRQELLLPGTHVRTSASFKFLVSVSIDQDIIEHGPIKLITVKSGEVRVCYHKGKVEVLKEGRYAVNSGTWRVAHVIQITQANMRFSKHPVLLDGGICLLVEGLLTFQVVDVEKLIKELGDRDLNHAIEDVTKAEIARVFAGIHLEQISSATTGVQFGSEGFRNSPAEEERKAFLGGAGASGSPTTSVSEGREFEERSRICSDILRYVRPIGDSWGVKIINFQLESTKIADPQYASEYEAASLGMAKAKANLRAIDSENEILLRQAEAKARSILIAAEAEKTKMILQAKGAAESRKIEAISRNQAAQVMKSDFARQYALQGQQVAFASKLKAQVLTITPGSSIGQGLIKDNMFAPGSAAITAGSASAAR